MGYSRYESRKLPDSQKRSQDRSIKGEAGIYGHYKVRAAGVAKISQRFHAFGALDLPEHSEMALFWFSTIEGVLFFIVPRRLHYPPTHRFGFLAHSFKCGTSQWVKLSENQREVKGLSVITFDLSIYYLIEKLVVCWEGPRRFPFAGNWRG